MSFFLNLRGQRSPTRLRRSKTSVDAFRVQGWDRPVARTVGFRLTKNGAIKDQMFKASLLIASVRKNFMSDLRVCLDNNSSNFKQIRKKWDAMNISGSHTLIDTLLLPMAIGSRSGTGHEMVSAAGCLSLGCWAGRDHHHPETRSKEPETGPKFKHWTWIVFFYHVVISTKNILQHWIEDVCSSDWFAWFNACMLYMFPFSEQCPAAIWRANPHKILSLALMGWSLDQRDHGLHAGSAVYCLANVTSLMTSQKSPKVTQLWYIQTTYPNNIS